MKGLLVNLGGEHSKWLKPSRRLGIVLMPILESLVKANQLYLRTHHVPKLYESGVRYENEPFTKDPSLPKLEEFALIPAIINRGWGDCDDLAPWRVAELREQGEKAKIRVSWKKYKGGKLFHITVRRGRNAVDPKTGRRLVGPDGKPLIEDPSRILGMGA